MNIQTPSPSQKGVIELPRLGSPVSVCDYSNLGADDGVHVVRRKVSLKSDEVQALSYPPKKYIATKSTVSERRTSRVRVVRRSSSGRNKKVRFLYNEFGEIDEQEIASTIQLTKDDIKEAWWGRKELRLCRERALETCRFYMREQPDFKKAATRLLELCGAQRMYTCVTQDESVSSLGSNTDSEGEEEDEEEEEDDDDELINTIVYGESRGLEKRIITALNLPFYRHKRSIMSAIDTQARLRDMEPGFFSDDQRVRLIASQYSLNAKYATTWARIIAQGDAKAAKQNYQFSM